MISAAVRPLQRRFSAVSLGPHWALSPVSRTVSRCQQRNYSSSSAGGDGSDEPPSDKNQNKSGDPPITSSSTSGQSGVGASGTGGVTGGKANTGGEKEAGGKKGNQWWCPKCGDPCTHVDTFVCE